MASNFRVISINVNGIRAAARKGFFDWLATQDAQVVCLQEIRAQKSQLTDPVFFPKDYHCVYVDPIRKGYSGVAIYSQHPFEQVQSSIGIDWVDEEARYVQIELGQLQIISLYLPSGSHSQDRQQRKFAFMEQYLKILKSQLHTQKPFIICGDWNIAHKKIDIKNWRSNQKNSGFLPEERAWMDTLFDEVGFVDAFRVVNQEPDQYTWWSNRGRAWENNVGWRIDYQVVTPNLKAHIQNASIFKEARFSDHSPLIIDFDQRVVDLSQSPTGKATSSKCPIDAFDGQ